MEQELYWRLSIAIAPTLLSSVICGAGKMLDPAQAAVLEATQLKEYWVNVYGYNKTGDCYKDKKAAIIASGGRAIYRIHVKMKPQPAPCNELRIGPKWSNLDCGHDGFMDKYRC